MLIRECLYDLAAGKAVHTLNHGDKASANPLCLTAFVKELGVIAGNGNDIRLHIHYKLIIILKPFHRGQEENAVYAMEAGNIKGPLGLGMEGVTFFIFRNGRIGLKGHDKEIPLCLCFFKELNMAIVEDIKTSSHKHNLIMGGLWLALVIHDNFGGCYIICGALRDALTGGEKGGYRKGNHGFRSEHVNGFLPMGFDQVHTRTIADLLSQGGEKDRAHNFQRGGWDTP